MKHSLEHGYYPHWMWSMRSTINPNTDMPDFILLIGEYKSGSRHYYLFPVDHPVFFIDGTRKRGIVYNLNPINKIDMGYEVLTPQLMEMYENAFHLIEDLRLKKIEQLKQQALLQQNQ